MSFHKTRVVYTNHTGKVSGAEAVFVNMLRGLSRSQYDVLVLCPEEGELQQMVRAEGVETASIPEMQARFTLRPDRLLRYASSVASAVMRLRREIKRVDPDLVHANTVRAGIATTIATVGTGKTVVWHVHDILPKHPLSDMIRFLAYIFRRTKIIAVSQATAEAFRGQLPFHDRISVIHNGTDLSRFPMRKSGNSLLKRELGLSKDSFLICAVGQICARKGLRELLEAFMKIQEAAPEIHLAIVGKTVFAHETKYKDTLMRITELEGLGCRVHFTGERRDIAAVFQSADLVVLNSQEEPFGLVLVEAMSSGAPVLATRVGGIPEIVTDGENGWLVAREDIGGLAAKILELSRNKAMLESVTQQAREVTCPQFSLEKFQFRLNALYVQLIAQRDKKQNAHAERAVQI